MSKVLLLELFGVQKGGQGSQACDFLAIVFTGGGILFVQPFLPAFEIPFPLLHIS